MKPVTTLSLCFLLAATHWANAQESPVPTLRTAGINVTQSGEVATVTINGQIFTRYLAKSGNRPILWPIYGPTGVEMTRSWPMQKSSGPLEATDHPHHRSMWFSHGDVNGTDFWSEPDEDRSRLGSVVHREFLTVQGGEEPTIVTCNEWLDPDGEKLCSDVRSLRFGADEDHRWIDFDIVVTNDTEELVKFGDTKEGTFGIRVAPWMKVDTADGNEETNGRIVNSLGMADKEAWGKAASWVDYSGEHRGERLGIAILNHPHSFRFPTHWHVRTYGLFAANSFGLHNFKNSDDEDGSHELQPGESMAFYFRVLLHTGDEQEGRVPEAFVEYAKTDKAAEGDERSHEELANESAPPEIELVEDAAKPEPAEEPTEEKTEVATQQEPSDPVGAGA